MMLSETPAFLRLRIPEMLTSKAVGFPFMTVNITSEPRPLVTSLVTSSLVSGGVDDACGNALTVIKARKRHAIRRRKDRLPGTFGEPTEFDTLREHQNLFATNDVRSPKYSN
jgi:hypothetical protein